MRIKISLVLSVALYLLVSNAAVAERYGAKICHSSEFKCYTAKRGDTWNKLFPDEHERNIVKRINRMNVGLSRGEVIAIPVTMGSSFMEYSPFPAEGEATGNKYIIVSKSKLAFGAYDGSGRLQYWGPISSAKGYCPDLHRGCHTPSGIFAIYNKGGAGCVSSKFPIGRGGAPMPYCMFFHGGFALHGSYQVPGYNASHGCVRMFVDDAKYLNREFTAGEHRVIVRVEQ